MNKLKFNWIKTCTGQDNYLCDKWKRKCRYEFIFISNASFVMKNCNTARCLAIYCRCNVKMLFVSVILCESWYFGQTYMKQPTIGLWKRTNRAHYPVLMLIGLCVPEDFCHFFVFVYMEITLWYGKYKKVAENKIL